MKDRRYYIRKNGILSETTYEEYQKYVSHKKQRGNVYFVCIQNTLLEVTEDMYMKHYRAIRRKKYLTREVPYEILYYQSLDTDEILGEELLYDSSGLSIEDKAIHHIYADKLYSAMEQLTDEERDLLYRLYYQGLSERILAKQLGISQAAVHKRKEKILKQLRMWMQL